MKALVYEGEVALAYRETPEPAAGPGEVLIRVARVGICGTELGAVGKGRPKLEPGVVLGHEFAGFRHDTGEAVAVNPLVACLTCDACRRGDEHLCDVRSVIGVHRNGAFAPLVAVPERNVLPIGNLPPERGALIEPLATGLHALRLIPQTPTRLAIIGAGSIGLAALAAAKRDGVEHISVSDIAHDRLGHARSLGAHVTGVEHKGRFDAVIDAVGTEQTRSRAIELLRAGGTAVLVGLASPQIALVGGPVIAGEKTLRGAFGFTPAEFSEALEIAREIPIEWVATYPLREGSDVFGALLRGAARKGEVKVQLDITQA